MEWISVEDRLPEDGGFYIVGFKNGGSFLGWYNSEKWHNPKGKEYGITKFGDNNTVTHWMPLPKPPKEGGE